PPSPLPLSLHDALPISHREVAWSEPQFGVFFAPQRWATTELSYSGERAADLGLILAADLGVASQWVGFDGGELDQSIVPRGTVRDRKSTRLNSSHVKIS